MHMVLDGRHLEMQPGRDLLVRQPLVEQKCDLELPRRQRLLRRRAGPLGRKPGHPPQQGAGRLRRDDELPLRGPLDGLATRSASDSSHVTKPDTPASA